MIDRQGRELERFLTTGIDAETHAAIGELPRGRGLLGVLIRESETLRLHDIAEDPRSVGFPPNHPPMHNFLGVPVKLRGVAYGNLYLTEKQGDDFTEEDEELVGLLASQAAVAIENARLYESATRWLRQLESLNEIGNALVGEIELPRLLELVARRLRELVDARMVLIQLPTPHGTFRVEAAVGEGAEDLRGFEVSEDSKVRRIFERRRRENVPSLLDDPEVDQITARRFGAHAALYVPLLARDEAIGVMVAFDKHNQTGAFDEDDVRLGEAFAARAAIAVELSERVARDSLQRVVAAQELERKRLARELHDETGQALTSILLGLRGVEQAKDAEARERAAAELRELVVQTLQDVRRLAVELRPSALDDFGLVPAIERLTETFSEQTGISTDLEARLDGRLPPDIETVLYRIVQEALTNVVKHADADRVSIVVTGDGSSVTTVIEDNGRGFDPAMSPEGGLGLLGMRERIALLQGRLSVESSPGAGTTLAVEVPL